MNIFVKNAINKCVDYIRENKIKSILYFILFYFIFTYLSLPNASIQKLSKGEITKTALMNQRISESKIKNKRYQIKQKWVPLANISRHVINALIVAEDGKFFEHDGVDWYEIEESIEKNIKKGKTVRGGSTITQQLAKNLYLSTSKTPLRKIEELIITLRIEKILSKKRIIEIYLNAIEFGNGIFGIEMASRIYFKKSASALSRSESIQLVSIIPSPLRHTPNDGSRFVSRRSFIINNRMVARGW